MTGKVFYDSIVWKLLPSKTEKANRIKIVEHQRFLVIGNYRDLLPLELKDKKASALKNRME